MLKSVFSGYHCQHIVQTTKLVHFFFGAALAGALLLLAAASDFLAIARTAKDLLFLLTITLKRSRSLKLARLA